MNPVRRAFSLVTAATAAVSFLSFTGCGDDPVAPAAKKKSIWPVGVGSYWVYESDLGEVYEMGIAGTTTVTYNGVNYKVSVLRPYDTDTGEPIDEFGTYLRNASDGLWYYGEEYFDGSDTYTWLTRIRLLKYPVQAGDSWEIDIESETATVTCVSTGTDFTTPLGDFSCIVYQFEWSSEPGSHDLWYCVPNVGRVGIEYQWGEETHIERLIEYHVE